MYKTESVICMCVCVCVCLFVPYTRLQFWADLDQIWHVSSLYPPDGHGPVASVASALKLTLRAPSIYAAANGWASSVVEFGTSGQQAQRTERRRRECAPLVNFTYLLTYLPTARQPSAWVMKPVDVSVKIRCRAARYVCLTPASARWRRRWHWWSWRSVSRLSRRDLCYDDDDVATTVASRTTTVRLRSSTGARV